MKCSYLPPSGVQCPVCYEIHNEPLISAKWKWAIGITLAVGAIVIIFIAAKESHWLDVYMYDNDKGKYRMNANYTPNKETGEIRPRRIPRRSYESWNSND